MQLDITGRQIEVTPALREFAEEKLARLERVLDGPIHAHLVVGVEKYRHFADLQVTARLGKFTGHHTADDLHASILEATDKLERQAIKEKQKRHDHKHRRSPRTPDAAAAILENEARAAEDES